MERGTRLDENISNVKHQKVKDDGFLGAPLQDEAIEVHNFLAEPKAGNVSVDAVLSFGGLDFVNTRGQDDFGLGDLDGLLDEVDEVEDIYAADDISRACENLILDIELTEKVSDPSYFQSERSQLVNSSSESHSPGSSGSINGASGQSESSTAAITGCKNISIETTENGIRFTSRHLDDFDDGDVKPLAICMTSVDNERKSVRATVGSADIREKRVRRPTKRYIEESSGTKSRDRRGNRNMHFTASRDKHLKNGATDELHHPTALYAFKGDSHVGAIAQTMEDSEVYLNEKLSNIIKRRKLSSAASKDTHLETGVAAHNELQYTMASKPTSRGESSIGNVDQEQPRRKRGRPKKTAFRILESDVGSDSEEEYVQRWKSNVPKSKNHDDRRKHQRMWTLAEVMKLIDGIAHYGTGRWTDIKKVMFSSTHYRTPMDLRDKWRNLLRASHAYKQKEKKNKQVEKKLKQATHPLPNSVLCRVGELATIHPYPRFTPGGRYKRAKKN